MLSSLRILCTVRFRNYKHLISKKYSYDAIIPKVPLYLNWFLRLKWTMHLSYSFDEFPNCWKEMYQIKITHHSTFWLLNFLTCLTDDGSSWKVTPLRTLVSTSSEFILKCKLFTIKSPQCFYYLTFPWHIYDPQIFHLKQLSTFCYGGTWHYCRSQNLWFLVHVHLN